MNPFSIKSAITALTLVVSSFAAGSYLTHNGSLDVAYDVMTPAPATEITISEE